MSKYWVANNPNSEITDAQAQKLKEVATSAKTAFQADPGDLPECIASLTAIIDLLVDAGLMEASQGSLKQNGGRALI